MRVCPSLACLILAACSSSSSSSNPDAAAMGDAAAPSVRTVTCPPGDMPTVTTSDSDVMYTPMMTTISAHGLVKFVMSPAHNVAPNPLKPTDPALMVDFGRTACLEFDKAGTFNFMCTAHGFVGSIAVE